MTSLQSCKCLLHFRSVSIDMLSCALSVCLLPARSREVYAFAEEVHSPETLFVTVPTIFACGNLPLFRLHPAISHPNRTKRGIALSRKQSPISFKHRSRPQRSVFRESFRLLQLRSRALHLQAPHRFLQSHIHHFYRVVSPIRNPLRLLPSKIATDEALATA